jgi:hypothetical protein
MRYPGGLIASSPVNAAYPSGVWTQAQTQPYAAQNVWMRDQFWPNTTLLLQGNGTNGAQNNTFLDSSTNNFTITRNGNTTQGSFTPYEANGYWSNYFDGATSTRLTFPSNTAFAFGTGAYTVEAWVYLTAHAATQTTVVDCGTNTGSFNFSILSTGALSLGVFGVGSVISSSGGAVSLNAWNHVAVVRQSTGSNATSLYVNGVSVATGTDSGNYTVTTTPAIGGLNSSGFTATGYISNVRIVKGTAVYTSAFTPSTSPLTAITNTSLLTCQSNRFIDNSTNAFAITVNGNTAVQAFQPFPGATTWSGSVLGGSGYFDGSGDWLSAPNNAAFAWGTGSLTVECWFYLTATAQYQVFLSTRTNAGVVGSFLGIETGTSQPVWYNNNASVALSSVSAALNTWNHVAFVRNGTTSTIYLNGVSVASGTDNNNYAAGNGNVGYDTQDNNWAFNGYISNLRAVKGSAVYTSTFTPPSAPLTAISNTSLLLNFTNAGIFDSAMMNNLETVGNAQVSTSVVKYGTGSMAFDGSGDYLTLHNVLTSNLGSGPFTVELWVYFNSASGTQFILSNYQSVTVGWGLGIASGNFAFWATGDTPDISTSVAAATGVWYHLAVSGQSGAIRLFLNGTQIGSTFTGTPALNSTATLRIGDGQGAASPLPFNGYIDDLRITKGAARYIGNFTPPVARMPGQ